MKKILYLIGIPITLLIIIGTSFLWASKYSKYDCYDRDGYYDCYDRDGYYERGDRDDYHKRGDRRRWDDRGSRGYGRGYGMMGRWDDRGGRGYGRGYGMMGYGMDFSSVLRSFDDDGDIELEEAQNFSTKVFDSYDSNNDEKLTKEEFVDHNVDREKKIAKMSYYDLSDSQISKIKKGLQSRFSTLDEDGDGYLNKDEFIDNRMNGYFEEFDLNGDGVIDQKEMRRRR